MDFIKLAQARRSVRSYLDRDVPDDIITQLLQAAQAAPSGGNSQPWHFFVVKDKNIMTQINEKSCTQSWLSTVPMLIVVCADIERSGVRYKNRGRELYCIQDTAAAIENILLCAQSLELGSCWIGSFDEAALSGILNLQNDMRPVAMLSIGYPESTDTPRTKRRPIEEITTYIYPKECK